MKELSDDKISLIRDFEKGTINKEDFEKRFELLLNYNQLVELLKSSINVKNEQNYNSLFHSILWHVPKKIVPEHEEQLYRDFLLKEGHNEHEEFARGFQLDFNNNIENIEYLLKAITSIPDYLSPDDFKYPYIRKLIYAIGAQPEPFNIEALEKLANETEDEQIKTLALHQIEKRKKLGRWEASKTAQ